MKLKGRHQQQLQSHASRRFTAAGWSGSGVEVLGVVLDVVVDERVDEVVAVVVALQQEVNAGY